MLNPSMTDLSRGLKCAAYGAVAQQNKIGEIQGVPGPRDRLSLLRPTHAERCLGVPLLELGRSFNLLGSSVCKEVHHLDTIGDQDQKRPALETDLEGACILHLTRGVQGRWWASQGSCVGLPWLYPEGVPDPKDTDGWQCGGMHGPRRVRPSR
eukprot:scaffold270_cov390-Prasinococcus_capsulatus_cf.AAC.20